MKLVAVFVLLVLFVCCFEVCVPTVDSAETSLFEYYNTGDDVNGEAHGNYLMAQTFTVGSLRHSVSSVKLKLRRSGTIGTVVVSVQGLDGSDNPDGTDLTNGTLDGSTVTDAWGTYLWYEVELTEFMLEPSTSYALVVNVPEGDSSNELYWRVDSSSPTYSGGSYQTSLDGGSNWFSFSMDAMFEVYGKLNTVFVTLDAVPSGLEVRIDGGAWFNSPHTFEIINGTSHNIEANSVQSGGEHTQYVWSSWNDTGANPHSVSPSSNITYVANFTTQYRLRVISYPEGSNLLTVNSSTIETPYTSDWLNSGSNLTLTATNKTVTANQERYVFDRWSNGGAISQNFTLDGSELYLYFDHQFYFDVSPATGSPTGEGWYDEGATTVNSTVTSPSGGADVTGWTGTGSLTSGSVGASNSTGVFTISEYSTCSWLWSSGPSFSDFVSSKASVTSSQMFNVTATVTHGSSIYGLVNASLGLGNGIVLFWDNATDAFSISTDTHGYVTLGDSSCSLVVSGTEVDLVWEFSLGSSFPAGAVNVLESTTKVYDNSSYVDSGSYASLFIFGDAVGGGGGGGGGVTVDIPATVSDIVNTASQAALVISDNIVNVVLLGVFGLLSIVLYYRDFFWLSVACIVVFAVFALNFLFLAFLIPTFPVLSPLGDWLIHLPTLQIEGFDASTQVILQVFTISLVGVVCFGAYVEVSNNRVY